MAAGETRVRTTKRTQFVEITDKARAAVRGAGVQEAVCTVFVPHTTAGVTINENADPAVVRDMLAGLERLVPARGNYEHREGNSDAHIKASLMGSSVRIPVVNGSLVLGTWQGIYFCEFDGPRSRRVIIEVA